MSSIDRDRSMKFFNVHSHSRNSSQMGYGPVDTLHFQLNHNKGQLLQHQERDKKQMLDEIEQQRLPKLPKVRSYPSKSVAHQEIGQGEKIELSMNPFKPAIPTFYVRLLEFEYEKWRPAMREGATFVCIEKKGYLYGGISGVKYKDLSVYDLEWSSVDFSGEKPNFGRCNHSASAYRRTIYFYGGEKLTEENTKQRECANDFRSFNLETSEWRNLRVVGDVVEGRRGHASVMVGKNFLVFGGVNIKAQFRGDLYHMDIGNLKVSKAAIANEEIFENGIAFHSLVAVYNWQRTIALYRGSQEENNTLVTQIKQEGVYCFGGEKQNGEMYEDLYILKTFQRPMFWIKAETVGQAPIARARHSCNFSEYLGALIIYGGISKQATFLNDLHILKVDTLTWCNVDVSASFGSPRAGHSSIMDGTLNYNITFHYQDKILLLFGGYNDKQGFLSGDIEHIEIDVKRRIEVVLPDEQPSRRRMPNEDMRLMRIKIQVENLQFNKHQTFLPMPVKKRLDMKVTKRDLELKAEFSRNIPKYEEPVAPTPTPLKTKQFTRRNASTKTITMITHFQ